MKLQMMGGDSFDNRCIKLWNKSHEDSLELFKNEFASRLRLQRADIT